MKITQALESSADGVSGGVDAAVVADALTTFAAVLERIQTDLRGLEARVALVETQGPALVDRSDGADLSREAAILELQAVAERLC